MKDNSSQIEQLEHLNAAELRRLLAEHLTSKRLGLNWESNSIARDSALNADLVFPRLKPENSHNLAASPAHKNLIIEGDNFDALRLLKSTHRGKIRVIYIDPPYNTGNKDWVYNDRYVGSKDRWRHSQWLEFLYQRLTLARDLLTPDGVIMLSINDENRSRLELLMDDVMPGRRLGSIAWRTRQGSNADQGCFLSVDHEHILVYGNSDFKFNGYAKTYSMYSNTDNDPRGDWRLDNLTLGFSHVERPNLYYPLKNPKTGIFYPASPERVWVYATEERLAEGQRVQAKTMEEFIGLGQIVFPEGQRIEVWETMEDLLSAIDAGDVPKSGKNPLLRRGLPDLEFWVGKPVGFGRPQFKRYKADLRNQTQPLSSWVVPSFEDGEYDSEGAFIAGTNQEGARAMTSVFGSRAFNYAKPVSLIKNLLQQATKPSDIVLDFFAGSGTTGQAVLELNADDGGDRSFILCSSTEATAKDPDKNLCRDVCAERLRRAMAGYSDVAPLGGSFAYLQMDKIEPADIGFDDVPEHAAQLLSLRHQQAGLASKDSELQLIANDGQLAIWLCFQVNKQSIETLKTCSAQRIQVYSPRPEALESQLLATGREVISYSLEDALLRGQQAKGVLS